MSDLTEALDRILNWLQQQRRQHPDSTQEWWLRSPDEENNAPVVSPGLSYASIEEITKDLQLELPPEIFELYQWGNGTQYDSSLFEFDWLFDIGQGWGFFMGVGYFPLQMAVTESLQWNKGSILNIFIGRECIEGYLVFDKNYQDIPVIFRNFKGGANETIIKYASLTNMMLTVAECYEQAYYINNNGYFSKDEDKAFKIWHKYNSEQIVSATLKKIKQLEPKLPELDENTGVNFLQEIGETLKISQDPRLITPLIRILRRPPTNTATDDKLDNFRSQASMFLGWLGGTDAVEPLIQALKDEYWLTRYWAIITLGDLKNSKALSSLTELLEDSEELVRQAATEALSKITHPGDVMNPLYSNPAVANLEATAALYGMTLSDMLHPNIEILRDKLNPSPESDGSRDSGSIDDNPDNNTIGI